MAEEQSKTHYTLYIDECGDPNLEKFDKTFPIFTLCGILVPENKLRWLEKEVKSLKQELWGNEDIIFHSHEIRNCRKDFYNLLDNEIKSRFYTRVNEIL